MSKARLNLVGVVHTHQPARKPGRARGLLFQGNDTTIRGNTTTVSLKKQRIAWLPRGGGYGSSIHLTRLSFADTLMSIHALV